MNNKLLNLLKGDLVNYKNKLEIAYENKTFDKITQNYYVYEYLRNRIENYEILIKLDSDEMGKLYNLLDENK